MLFMNTNNPASQYGPYSPQEVDRISTWLQQQNIPFDIIRNDQDAREALMNDGQNVVNLADLRTGIYLAQIFYIQFNQITEVQKKDFETRFTLKEESFPRQHLTSPATDEAAVHAGNLRHQYKKRTWALFLAFLLIVQVMVALYHIVFKEA
jgi:hypothetical protein